MKVDQARRLKDLKRENAHLKRAVANLTVDKRSRLSAGFTGRVACVRNVRRASWSVKCSSPDRFRILRSAAFMLFMWGVLPSLRGEGKT